MTEEEFCILNNEQFLGYGKHTSRQIEFCFKRFSRNGRMAPAQFNEACKHLQINVSGIASPADSKGKVYAQLRSGDDFLTQRLVAMAVLLSTGKPREKAEQLFDHCDEDFTESVTASVFRQLLSDLIFVAINAIPHIAVG